MCGRYYIDDGKKENDVMVRHVILRTLKDELSGAEKRRIMEEMKEALEGLNGKIPGMIDMKLYIDGLASSSADMMLDSVFESEEALKAYSVNPIHVKVADEKVRPYTKSRICMDFIEEA